MAARPAEAPAGSLADELAALLRPEGVTGASLTVDGSHLASFGARGGPPAADHTAGPVRLRTWGERAARLGGLVRVWAGVHDGLTGNERLLGSLTQARRHLASRAELQDASRETDARGIVEDHDAASRIAQMVLPAEPPVLPGYDLAHAAFPARAAGGDFVTYGMRGEDLFFAVGDVSGKGLPAALIMTRLKAALDAAFARHDIGAVGEVAAEVTGAVHGYLVDNQRIATLVVGGLEADTGILRLYNAGHSPAFAVQDGEPLDLSATAPPLGVLPEATGGLTELDVAPGSWLVVGSDGLVEQEDATGTMLGLDRLAGAVAALDGHSSAVVVSRLLSIVEGHAGDVAPCDDRTVLVIRRASDATGEPGDDRATGTLRFDADLVTVRRLGPWLRRTGGRVGAAESTLASLELALHELCVNIVQHAYCGAGGPVVVRAWVRGGTWRVQVRDRGAPFDESRRPTVTPGEARVRGYGLMLVEQLADRVGYHRDGPDNVWELDVTP